MPVSNEKITKVILEAIGKILEELPPEEAKRFNRSSALLGKDSPFDSLSLVTLIVDLEEKIQDQFGATVVLANERALSQSVNPFSTVDALANYVGLLLSERDA